MKFKLIVEQNNDGLFIADCPMINGCVSQGKTKDEAIKNIHNAIKGYMKILRIYNQPFPPAMNSKIESLPYFSSEQLVTEFKKIGFEIDHKIGGHIFIRQRAYPHRILSIPEYNKISRGVLKNLIQQSGLTITEFKNVIKKK